MILTPFDEAIPLAEAPVHRVYQTGLPVRVDLGEPGTPAAFRERLLKHGVKSFLAAPIKVSSRLWGAVAVSRRRLRSRSRLVPRSVSARSRSSFRSRWRTRRRVDSWLLPELGSCPRATRSGGASSETSTTGRSSASSRCPSRCASPSSKLASNPGYGGRASWRARMPSLPSPSRSCASLRAASILPS